MNKYNRFTILRRLNVLRRKLLIANTSDQEAHKKSWQNIKNRRHYIPFIIENPAYKGLTKTETESIFGKDESGDLYPNRWTYSVCLQGSKKYVLALYFEDNILISLKFEYTYID